MASPVATAAINTSRTKVVGSGLHMRCAVNRSVLGISEDEARKWQRKTEAEWRMWAERASNCDALGLNNFYELQQLALKSCLMSGDAFALLKRTKTVPYNPYTLRLHIVEADRISTPTESRTGVRASTEGKNRETGNKIHDGVEVNKSGKVEAYHICSTYPSLYSTDKVDWTRVKAIGERTGLPNILHIMKSERPDQYRGVSFLAPVIEILLQMRRYTEAQLFTAVVQTFFTAWIKTTSEKSEFPFAELGGGDVLGEPGTQPEEVSYDEREYEMGPGQVQHLAPDEDIVFGNPNVPSTSFDVFVKTLCRLVGAALEIPYDVLIKEFNSSYSVSKGALEEAWETFKMWRSSFISDFCQPTYETWLAEAVAIGRIKAPGFFDNPVIREAWCGARWDGPAQTHLDPVKEATANQMAVAAGWKTNEQVTREYYGGSWEENVERLLQERELIGVPETPDTSNNDEEEDNAEDN